MAQLSKDTIIGDGTRTINIFDQFTKLDEQTVSLKHGVGVIESDQASPMKVEFYGRTLVNLLGKDGNFDTYKSSKDSGVSKTTDSTVYKYGNKSLKVTAEVSGYVWTESKNYKVDVGKHYILLTEGKSDGVAGSFVRVFYGNEGAYEGVLENSLDTNWRLGYRKFKATTDTIRIGYYARSGMGSAWYDGSRLYEIDQATYNKIGVSLTDADVERMFPYVDSVQHVKNPVLSVEGQQLIKNHIGAWNSYNSPNEMTYSNGEFSFIGRGDTDGYQQRKRAIPNQKYTMSVNLLGRAYLSFYDKEGNAILIGTILRNATKSYVEDTQTAPSNAYEIQVKIDSSNLSNGETVRFSELMLNLGDTAKPYTEYNPSYLYAETTLAGNDNKKDILSYNEDKRRWEVKREFELVTLDGSFDFNESGTYTGFKRVYINLVNEGIPSSEVVVKNNGELLMNATESGGVWDKGDLSEITSSGAILYITIDNSDTGFTDTMTPSNTMWDGYFNGWKYTGDGTTHSWVSIVDGTTAPATQTEAFVADPANTPTGYKNYFLSYQLAEPVIEPVTVEGDLSISGDAQIEIGSGFTYTEDSEGNRTYTIIPDDERYDVTCNLTEVKATYQQSMKSSFQRVVEKQSDQGTDLTILKRQMLDVLVHLNALEEV